MGKLGKAFLFLMTVMLLLTAVSRAAAAFTVAQVQVEQPQSRKIVHTVTGDGIVEKMGELPVYAAADVLVAEVKVQKGQTVKKGDVLARLDMESIEENIRTIEGEIEALRLQNQAIAAQQKSESQARSEAKTRAKEDYNNTALENQMQLEAAAQAVEDAEQQLADATALAKRQRLEELQAAEAAAKKAYDDAKELAESEILLAKRAMEDASKTPAADYSAQILQIQINQKQSQLNELYRQRQEGREGLDDQIRLLEDELATLKLQLWGDQNADNQQAEEQRLAYLRAQEDYNNIVKKYERIVDEAEQAWNEAKQRLQEFSEDEEDVLAEDPSVKAAEKALETAVQQEKELAFQQGLQELQAKRNLEDASGEQSPDTVSAVNRIAIEDKQRQLAELLRAKDAGGDIVAQMDETITQVQLEVGQKTPETAVFLVSDTSDGMLFTTVIRKEDAVYVAVEDAVLLESAGIKYEGLSVLSMRVNEDESVEVTVYVPKDTLPLGAYAGMELTKQSEEYAVTVPLSAIRTENEKQYVYVMQPADTVLGGQYMAMRMDVTVAETNGYYAAISDSSLTAESQVIIDSDQIISAGETIRLSEE